MSATFLRIVPKIEALYEHLIKAYNQYILPDILLQIYHLHLYINLIEVYSIFKQSLLRHMFVLHAKIKKTCPNTALCGIPTYDQLENDPLPFTHSLLDWKHIHANIFPYPSW